MRAALAGPTETAAQGSLRPSQALDLAELERLVRARAADVEAAALAVDLAVAEGKKSRLLANPTLDLEWGTIPLGETNPRDLRSPFTEVPNYSVGLSYTFLLGKRGPLQDRAAALERAQRATLQAEVRGRAFALARVIGQLARVTLRVAGLHHVAEDGRHEAELGEARLSASFTTGLEVDRLKVEASRLEQDVRAAESELAATLAECSGVLGIRCETFASADEARGFLVRWIERAEPRGSIEGRADVRALAAQRDAASAEVRWATAQAIPDPTVRLGYTRDQFVVSGNQVNSLNVSVSLPLTIFDHGQAEVAAAEAKRARAAAQRQKAIEASRSRILLLRQRLEAQERRRRALAEEILPRAESALREVARAAQGRLVPMGDVIQARRTVSELRIAEADSLGDAFEASLAIAAELETTKERP